MRNAIITAIVTGIFIIGGAILSSPHWFKYFFPEQYLEQEKLEPVQIEKNESETNSNEEFPGTENLIIERIDLTPRQFDIPSYLYIEVKNNGTKIIKNLNIIINLGRANFIEYDYTKRVEVSVDIDYLDKSFIKIICPEIKKNESIELYAHLDLPVFDSVLLNGENLNIDKKYTYDEYIESLKTNNKKNGFIEFLIILSGIAITIFSIYFIIVIITLMSRFFKL